MKNKILITLGFLLLSQQSFAANDVVRYSDYGEDWTLSEQFFDIGDSSTSEAEYKLKTFSVGLFGNGSCLDLSSQTSVEYGLNSQGFGKIEIINNNENLITTWKFKPGIEFKSLNNEEEVIFCYGEGSALTNQIRIKKSGSSLLLHTVGSSNEKRIFIPKMIGDKGVELEVSFRCEPDDTFIDFDTGENEEKVVLFLKNLDLKTSNLDFGVKIEGEAEASIIDTKDTLLTVDSENVNANFYFGGAESSSETGSISELNNFLSQYPDDLELKLYKGKVFKLEDLKDYELIAEATGFSLSTSFKVAAGTEQYFSLVTKVKDSSANPSIKVYSITKFGAKLVKLNVVPGIAALGSSVDFEIVTNLSRTNSAVDYVEITFSDKNNFKPLKIKNKITGTGSVSSEQVFNGKYVLPTAPELNGTSITYDAAIILENGQRTEFDQFGEIYLGGKDALCTHPVVCVIRGLRALESLNKSDLEKIVVGLFTNNSNLFQRTDIYKKFIELSN